MSARAKQKKILLRFGRNVRQERLRRNLSQEHLAMKSKLSRNYIGMVERAERNITLATAEQIAGALGIRLENLI